MERITLKEAKEKCILGYDRLKELCQVFAETKHSAIMNHECFLFCSFITTIIVVVAVTMLNYLVE